MFFITRALFSSKQTETDKMEGDKLHFEKRGRKYPRSHDLITPLVHHWPSSARWRRPACSCWWWCQTCRGRRSRWSCSPSPRSRRCRRPWRGSLPPSLRAQRTRALWTRRGLRKREHSALWVNVTLQRRRQRTRTRTGTLCWVLSSVRGWYDMVIWIFEANKHKLSCVQTRASNTRWILFYWWCLPIDKQMFLSFIQVTLRLVCSQTGSCFWVLFTLICSLVLWLPSILFDFSQKLKWHKWNAPSSWISSV